MERNLKKLEVKAANQLNDGKDEEHMRCRLQKKGSGVGVEEKFYGFVGDKL